MKSGVSRIIAIGALAGVSARFLLSSEPPVNLLFDIILSAGLGAASGVFLMLVAPFVIATIIIALGAMFVSIIAFVTAPAIVISATLDVILKLLRGSDDTSK